MVEVLAEQGYYMIARKVSIQDPCVQNHPEQAIRKAA
jgi:hypothetical protein